MVIAAAALCGSAIRRGRVYRRRLRAGQVNLIAYLAKSGRFEAGSGGPQGTVSRSYNELQAFSRSLGP